MVTKGTTSFPEWVVPMAATLTQERFTGPEWIFERKHDGIRLLAFKNGDDVKLYSRNQLPQDYPAVAAAIATCRYDDLILDGELAWGSGSVAYHVFDILWLDGRDLTRAAARRSAARCSTTLPFAPRCTRRAIDGRQAVGARLPRRMGRRDREAPRLALRAPPLTRTG